MATLVPWTQQLLALPGVTTPQVEEKLRSALKEFYLQSRAYRRVLGPLTITSAQPSLALDPVDANTRVVWVRDAWLQDGSIKTHLVKAACKLTEPRTGRPTHYWLDPAVPSTLMLWPTPDVTLSNILHVEVALTVSDAATVFPDLSVSHHFEAILNGAFARLYAMPNKPWTDQLVANRYSQLFRRACSELRTNGDLGYQHSSPPFRFPPFA